MIIARIERPSMYSIDGLTFGDLCCLHTVLMAIPEAERRKLPLPAAEFRDEVIQKLHALSVKPS